jgi:hypothetical protein
MWNPVLRGEIGVWIRFLECFETFHVCRGGGAGRTSWETLDSGRSRGDVMGRSGENGEAGVFTFLASIFGDAWARGQERLLASKIKLLN